jgi:hypothetical protein
MSPRMTRKPPFGSAGASSTTFGFWRLSPLLAPPIRVASKKRCAVAVTVSVVGEYHGQGCTDRGYRLSKHADLRLIYLELALGLKPVPDLVAGVGTSFEVDFIGTVPQVGLRNSRLL